MGNNQAYTIFEATVVGAYNLGKLDKELLAVLMEPYRDCDIDSGGKEGLTSEKDGLEVEEICVKIMGGSLPTKPDLPKDYHQWTKAQDQANEDWQEALAEAFGEITEKFGWG